MSFFKDHNNVHSLTGNTTTLLSHDSMGLRVYVPEGVIPPGVECYLAVVPIASGKFSFPFGFKPVGGIYALAVSCNILKPITIEMEHCVGSAANEMCPQLTFARAQHDKVFPPYEFKPCKDGIFVTGSRYGSLDCHYFSFYTMLVDLASWVIGTEASLPTLSVERYKAILVYQKSKIVSRKWTVHFVVIKNLSEHMEVYACTSAIKN